VRSVIRHQEYPRCQPIVWFILGVGGGVGKLVGISHATQKCNCPDHSDLSISAELCALFVGIGPTASFAARAAAHDQFAFASDKRPQVIWNGDGLQLFGYSGLTIDQTTASLSGDSSGCTVDDPGW
jgi:hypothetical protein